MSLLVLLDGDGVIVTPPAPGTPVATRIYAWGCFMWGGAQPESAASLPAPLGVLLDTSGRTLVVFDTDPLGGSIVMLDTSGRSWITDIGGSIMDGFWIKKGDTLPLLSGALVGSNGQRPNCSGGSILVKIRYRDTSTVALSASATFTDAVNAAFSYAWQTADTASAYEGLLELEVTFASGKKQTFPTPGAIPFHCTEDVS